MGHTVFDALSQFDGQHGARVTAVENGGAILEVTKDSIELDVSVYPDVLEWFVHARELGAEKANDFYFPEIPEPHESEEETISRMADTVVEFVFNLLSRPLRMADPVSRRADPTLLWLNNGQWESAGYWDDGHAWDPDEERRWNRWFAAGCFIVLLLLLALTAGVVFLVIRP